MGGSLEHSQPEGHLAPFLYTGNRCMRFSVDAHAIGRHLTGNEVYIRNLLSGFAALDQTSDFIAYLSSNIDGASDAVPVRFRRRYVSANLWFASVWIWLAASARIGRIWCTFSTRLRWAVRSLSWSACTTSAFWNILNIFRGCAPPSCASPSVEPWSALPAS